MAFLGSDAATDAEDDEALERGLESYDGERSGSRTWTQAFGYGLWEGDGEESEECGDDDGTGTLRFCDVLQQERDAINRSLRARCGDSFGPRFSLAFSGGGVRAAAFQMGVLWRLAEAGCLKHIDYISAVSGGTWAAAAFASQVVEAGKRRTTAMPSEQSDEFYQECLARAICRMQANMPYIQRDVGKDACKWPDGDYKRRGSGCLPRIFDIPILVVAFAFTILVHPLYFILLVILPVTEFVAIIFGPMMRAALCETSLVSDSIPNFWLPLTKFSNDIAKVMYLLFGIVFIAFAAAVLQRFCCRKASGKHTQRWLLARGVKESVMRLAPILLSIVSLCFLATTFEFWEYKYKPMLLRDGVFRRAQQCDVYATSKSEVCDAARYREVRWTSKESETYQRLEVIQFMLNNVKAGVSEDGATTITQGSSEDQVLLRSILAKLNVSALHTLRRATAPAGSQKLILGTAGFVMQYAIDDPEIWTMCFFMPAVLLFSVVLFPLRPSVLQNSLGLLGPLGMVMSSTRILRWRIFGEIAGGGGGLSATPSVFTNGMWGTFFGRVIIFDMLALPLYGVMTSSGRWFYRRSLKRAFFASGKDVQMRDLRGSDGDKAYPPFILMGGTVTDYSLPGSDRTVNEITISPLHTGGDTLTYLPSKDEQSVSKVVGMCSGAPDALILGKKDALSYRFWLEFFNMSFGDFIFHGVPSSTAKSRLGRYLHRLPSLLLFELVYGLLYFANNLGCRGLCDLAEVVMTTGMVIQCMILVLSFFAFLPGLDFLLDSPLIRNFHAWVRYYHKSTHPPSLMYVTDGMVCDNSASLELLRRGCRCIIVVYGQGGQKSYQKLYKIEAEAKSERIASLFDPLFPDLSLGAALIERSSRGLELSTLHLAIGYSDSFAPWSRFFVGDAVRHRPDERSGIVSRVRHDGAYEVDWCNGAGRSVVDAENVCRANPFIGRWVDSTRSMYSGSIIDIWQDGWHPLAPSQGVHATARYVRHAASDLKWILEEHRRDDAAPISYEITPGPNGTLHVRGFGHVCSGMHWTLHEVGHLFFVQIPVEPAQGEEPVPPLLTANDIRRRRGGSMDSDCSFDGTDDSDSDSDSTSPAPPELRQNQLGGCCCDCCHAHHCNFGSLFPNPPTGNQLLTPQAFNCLVRLGRAS
eukprot:CAMPEP_0117545796 /NCGR_PEP_ID=MMETSP0784-20121206/46281_1 /TAXON_ID=39447 /ORGANISM="" /LENGTH=1147 /DNA_ID=CAMNT_0005342657 /DNA_START=15 /DNA_END=3455 /DNA_ORIENTATION=-